MTDGTISPELPELESFQTFFERWLSEQNQHLHHLILASQHNHSNNKNNNNAEDEDDPVLLGVLVERVVKHYETYYEVKSRWAEQDVLAMLSPPWTSSLEDAFFWIGGWRPSMAFHLLYAKSGLQLEAQLTELMQGLSTGDLADLSQRQLAQVDQLQMRTIEQEKHITHKMAKLQDTIADTQMVELSHVVTEMMRNNGHEEVDHHQDLVESTLASKEKDLEVMLHRADELRLRTIKKMTHILTPIQATHFLIAAAELHLRLHDWGKKKDVSGQRADHL
ncbi:hypothetical protein M0R45_005753 [Rubus argutus]|uniref:DOG1 domain-containing protein n=1 Tax=Rubus argutus TaxID=59490 RepID=A0AAW1YNI7_RUBAR